MSDGFARSRDRRVGRRLISKDFPMTPKPRLELTWIGKDVHLVLEPRILIEDPAKSS